MDDCWYSGWDGIHLTVLAATDVVSPNPSAVRADPVNGALLFPRDFTSTPIVT